MEYHIIDEEKNVLRYMRAVVLNKECMVCHGSVEDYPAGNGIDPIGFKMEGWEEGETHGALEILASLEPMQESVRTALIQIATVSAVIILVVIGVIYALVRRLAIKPVRSIRGLMEDIADGNLNRELQQDTEDDIGKTVEAVNYMVANLRRIIGQIQDSSNQVSDAAGQISDANNSFSQIISEQAASVEETSSTIEEMTASIENTTENIADANRIAETTRRMAEEGIPIMESTISGMDEINDSSERISNITNVIEDIAFQTNLLALNASVEAARAGDHGRGFAVVAGEVRNLAQRSSSSVKEITELITESRGKTRTGVERARKLGEQLEEIVDSVRKTTDYINEVNTAMMEQRDGVQQVNTAVDQIDKVTQQNASLVEENAASAEELAAQAREQLALISFFNIDMIQGREKLPTPDEEK
jgi:methyl-accepting chemotaxis protein